MVDCARCANYETDTCDLCIHGEVEQDDYYEELNPKEMAARERQWRENAEKDIPQKTLETDYPIEFINNLSKTEGFYPDITYRGENIKFYCTYCGEDYLLATDGNVIIKLNCEVPQELQGKHIFRTLHSFLAEHLKPHPVLSNGEALKLLTNEEPGLLYTTTSRTKQEITYKEYLTTGYSQKELVKLLDGITFLGKEYFDKIMALITDDEEVYMTLSNNPLKPVKFKTDNLEVLLMPVRADSVTEKEGEC